MRLLYFNVIEQNAGWGAEYFMNKALNKIGVETINIDYRENRYNLAKKLRNIKGDFDAVLLQRGDGFPLDILRSINRPLFFWASELVSRRNDQDDKFSSGLFKHYFVRGYDCRDTLVKRGWLKKEDISIFLSAFDSEIYKKDGDIEDKKFDISFVGSILPRRSKILNDLKKEFFVNQFRAYGERASEIFNNSKIVLNIHAENFLDTETRVFEVLGSGSFLLSEKLTKENPFKDGVHLAEAKNYEEIKSKIKYYLEHDEERNNIAQKGYIEATEKHTYLLRAKELVSVIEKFLDKKDNLSPFDNKKLNACRISEIKNIFKEFPRFLKLNLSWLRKKI